MFLFLFLQLQWSGTPGTPRLDCIANGAPVECLSFEGGSEPTLFAESDVRLTAVWSPAIDNYDFEQSPNTDDPYCYCRW